MLLKRAMEETGRVAIGRFVMRTKEYLATIRPYRDVLALETMYFADEVRSTEEVGNVPRDIEVSERELQMAEQLIEALTTRWQHEKYHDTYRERVMELIERKARGEAVVVRGREAPPAQVIDIMQALRASLEGVKERGAPPAPNGLAAAANEDLDAMSKAELYERATRARIPGRSKMSKHELVAALRQASP